MPRKVCNTPGCNKLVPYNERYCDEHRRDEVKRRNESYDNDRRDPRATRFYNSSAWKSVRDKVMRDAGGLCRSCQEHDMTVDADVVDHIIPIEVDWSKRLDKSNLQPLCHSCHAKKTADDVREYGRGV